MRFPRAFLMVWTFVVAATVAAFVLHLAFRGRILALGYEIGKARAEQARLRESHRVLQLEAASYKTSERVERIAHSLLKMEVPAAERIVSIRARSRPTEQTKLAQHERVP